jgi:uncharacterized membrane protein
MRGIPIALVVGLVLAVPLAFAVAEWRLVILVPLAIAGVTGGVLAAVEDGRVQRRVDRERRGGR